MLTLKETRALSICLTSSTKIIQLDCVIAHCYRSNNKAEILKSQENGDVVHLVGGLPTMGHAFSTPEGYDKITFPSQVVFGHRFYHSNRNPN